MNAAAHQLTAGALVGLFLADKEQKSGQATAEPLISGAAVAVLTKLRDLLEPATSPNHRQFFHSIAFASLLGLGLYKRHKWEPEELGGQVLEEGRDARALLLPHSSRPRCDRPKVAPPYWQILGVRHGRRPS